MRTSKVDTNKRSEDVLTQTFEGLGVILRHDSLSRQRPSNDNVLPILHEEHVVTWRLLRDQLMATLLEQEQRSMVDFLDVGTGSGIWAILVAKELQRRATDLRGRRIIAVDKVERMTKACSENLQLNWVRPGLVEVLHEPYSLGTAPRRGVRAIFMNPPYHIYPPLPEVERHVALHARGGSLGWDEFRSWLRIANEHLADAGHVYFHHMCLGDQSGPEWQNFIPELIEGVKVISAFDILEPLSTEEFLGRVYAKDHAPFVSEVSATYPLLYFTSGALVREIGYRGRPSVLRKPIVSDLLAGRTWTDRIELHRKIAGR